MTIAPVDIDDESVVAVTLIEVHDIEDEQEIALEIVAVPSTVRFDPTLRDLPSPNPPLTTTAPDVVVVESVVLAIDNKPVLIVKLCAIVTGLCTDR